MSINSHTEVMISFRHSAFVGKSGWQVDSLRRGRLGRRQVKVVLGQGLATIGLLHEHDDSG